MNVTDFFALNVLVGLIVLTSLFWWSSSWSPERRGRLHTLWPVVCLTVLLELIPFAVPLSVVYPRHWPLTSALFILTVAHVSRRLSANARIWVRALSFGVTFSIAPPIYAIFVPSILLPFLRRDELNGTGLVLAMAWSLALAAVLSTLAAMYLRFLARDKRSGTRA